MKYFTLFVSIILLSECIAAQDTAFTFIKSNQLTGFKSGLSKPRHGFMELMPDSTFRIIGSDGQLGTGYLFLTTYDSAMELQNTKNLQSFHSAISFNKAFIWNKTETFLVAFGDGDTFTQRYFNYIYDSDYKIIWKNKTSGVFNSNVYHSGDSVIYGSYSNRIKSGKDWIINYEFGFLKTGNYSIKHKSIYKILGKDSTKTKLTYNTSLFDKGMFYLFVEDSLMQTKLLVASIDTNFSLMKIDTIEFDGRNNWIKKVDNQILVSSFESNPNEPYFKLRSYQSNFKLLWTIKGKYDSAKATGIARSYDLRNDAIFPITLVLESYENGILYSELVKVNSLGKITSIRILKESSSVFRFFPVYKLKNRILGHLFTGSVPPSNELLLQTDTNGCFYRSQITTSLLCNPLSNMEYNFFQKINIYPNPTSSTLTISAPNNPNLAYSLLDLNGRQVLFGEFSNKVLLDVSELKRGMYFLRIRNDENGRVETRKVIVGS